MPRYKAEILIREHGRVAYVTAPSKDEARKKIRLGMWDEDISDPDFTTIQIVGKCEPAREDE